MGSFENPFKFSAIDHLLVVLILERIAQNRLAVWRVKPGFIRHFCCKVHRALMPMSSIDRDRLGSM